MNKHYILSISLLLVGTTQIHTVESLDAATAALVQKPKGPTQPLTPEQRAAKEAALAGTGKGIQKINPDDLLRAGLNHRGETVAGAGRRGIGATAKAKQQEKKRKEQEEKRAAKPKRGKRN